MALHHYHDVYGSFPPAFVPDGEGRPAHSWRILLLPYLDYSVESEHLYKDYRFDEPWNGPNNQKLANRIPGICRCPSFVKFHGRHEMETEHSRRLTNYVAISDQDGVFDGPNVTSIDEIIDGTSNTIVIAEARQHAVHWMQPDDVTPSEIMSDLQYSGHRHHANHLGGLHVLYADGAVRFLTSSTTAKKLWAIVSHDGGESTEQE